RDLPFYQELGNLGAPVPVTTRSELFGMHMKKHPEYLLALIMKLLEERPEDRFQSAKEVTQFINKNSGFHFEVQTTETQASYFSSSKLVGRRREINLLKEYHERVFYPYGWQETRQAQSAPESGVKEEALEIKPPEPALAPKESSSDARGADEPIVEET